MGSSASSDLRLHHDRPRDGHALPLAARQLIRAVMGPVGQPHGPERAGDARRALGPLHAGEDHRQLDVPRRREPRHEVVDLEDEPDLVARERATAPGRRGVDDSRPSSR